MAMLLILLVAALLPLLARRLPVSYLAWTLPMYALAITSHDFTSLPRYLGALFPALIAAALSAGGAGRRSHWSRRAGAAAVDDAHRSGGLSGRLTGLGNTLRRWLDP